MWPVALSAARYAYRLEGPAADLVHALKYEGWREASDFMSRSMADLVADIGTCDIAGSPESDIVVPIPTTLKRERSRGYNQAGLLATRVAARTGRPMRSILRRVGSEGSQTALSPEERRENVRGVFRLSGSGGVGIRGARVILVDDVLTTGATACEAAQVLTSEGAASVLLLAFARALPGGRTGQSKSAA